MRWPRWLVALVALVLSLGAAGTASASDAKRVVVGDVAGDDSGALRHAVVRALQAQGDVYVVSVDRAREVAGEKLAPDDLGKLAEELGVVALVEGKVAEDDGKWVVTLRVRATADGEVTESTKLEADSRHGLAQKVQKELWGELGPPLLDAKLPKHEKRRVLLGAISGKKSTNARDWVRAELERDQSIELVGDDASSSLDKSASPAERVRAAKKAGASALITGEVAVAGGKTRLTLQVASGADGEVSGELMFEGIGMPGLERSVKRDLGKRVAEPLSKTSPPEPPEEPEPPADTGDDEKVEKKGGPRPSPLELMAGVEAFSRNLSYTDDIQNRLRAYKLGLGPALFVSGTWYPLAHFQGGPGAHAGITAGYSQGLALKSEVSGGQKYDTTTREWFAGVRARIPLEKFELGASITYGVHVFVVYDDPVTPLVPDVRYRYVRLGADGRAHFGKALVGGSIGYRKVSDPGDIASDRWFPHATAGGLDLRVFGGYEVATNLDLLAGIDYRRYFLSMHSEPGDTNVAGGALDQFLAGWVGVGYTLPGGK